MKNRRRFAGGSPAAKAERAKYELRTVLALDRMLARETRSPSIEIVPAAKAVVFKTRSSPDMLAPAVTWREVGRRKLENGQELKVWEAECVVCGGAFQTATRIHANKDDGHFRGRTCSAHSLTAVDQRELQRARPGEARRIVFEAIK
jgi:hypothetical protein